MTDLEFLERLKQEFRQGSSWSDIVEVHSLSEDSELAENELRVYPRPDASEDSRISRFRLVVHWETAAARSL